MISCWSSEKTGDFSSWQAVIKRVTTLRQKCYKSPGWLQENVCVCVCVCGGGGGGGGGGVDLREET